MEANPAGWHAPGLGEVHAGDHRSMIYCETDDVVDDALAAQVCALLNKPAMTEHANLIAALQKFYGHRFTATRDGLVYGEHFDFSRHPLVGRAVDALVARCMADLSAIEAMQGGRNGPTIRLRAFINGEYK